MDLIYFDFQKAFDKVSHDILLRKLQCIGVSVQITNWIKCFLTERVMQVRVASALSSPVAVTSGVPQGSVLGPVLFLIYINHTVTNLRCKYMVFADDIKLYLAHFNESSLSEQVLQTDIDTLVETSSSWGMHMNISKCKCMRFNSHRTSNQTLSPYNINGDRIEYTYHHRDLGVKVDSKLKFHSHVAETARICNGLTTNFFSSTLCRDRDFLLNLYLANIRPKLEYASTLWSTGYAGDLRKLERVQRRWTRKMRGLENLSYPERLHRLDLFSVKGRLLRADLIMVWKIFNGKCAISPEQLFVMSSFTYRGHNLKIYKPRIRLDIRRRSFACRVVADWNALSSTTVNCQTVESFKKHLQEDLGHKLFEFTN